MNPQLNVKLSGILQMLNAGNIQQAISGLHQAVKNYPDSYQPSELLAQVLMRSGRAKEAVQHAKQANRLNNNNNTCQTLGLAYEANGNIAAALESFKNACKHAPRDENNYLKLAALHFRSGQLVDALSNYLAAAKINATNTNAWYGAGFVARHLGDHDNALKYLDKSVQVQPENSSSWIVRGEVLRELGEYELAHQSNEKAQRLLRFPDKMKNSQDKETRFGHTSAHKLRHDIDQFEYLAGKGVRAETMRKKARSYARVLDSLDKDNLIHRLSPEQRELLGDEYNTPINIYKTKVWKDSPINRNLDCKNVEEEYLANDSGVVCIDGLLDMDFLEELRRYCLESTIWYDFVKAGGYIGAYHVDGFNATIIQQLAECMRNAFPKILGGLPLINTWAYKYDSQMSGITTHADDASVNINFWITPDAGCLDNQCGGLDVYTKEVSLNWDFNQYNNNPELIEQHLVDSACISVPHRQNRAVMFNSNLFHKTQDINFREEYEYRRINITMLYGKRGQKP